MDRGVECFLNETAPLIVGVVMNGAEEDTLRGRGFLWAAMGKGGVFGAVGVGETIRKRRCKRPREECGRNRSLVGGSARRDSLARPSAGLVGVTDPYTGD